MHIIEVEDWLKSGRLPEACPMWHKLRQIQTRFRDANLSDTTTFFKFVPHLVGVSSIRLRCVDA